MSVRLRLVLLLSACAHAPPQRSAVVRVMLAHVKEGGPNHTHMMRLARLAPRFAKEEGVSTRVVEAAVLLHDATKEDGQGTPVERFCTHGAQAAALARAALPALGYSAGETAEVARAIEEHMGPLGDNPEFQAPRFMTAFCRREFPVPSTAASRVVFDLDMLDLMTVDGIVKVVTLRQRSAEFARESLEDSARSGRDSAWKSVVDARQVLTTAAGRRCGALVEAHSRGFLDGVDFTHVRTVDDFSRAARAFVEAHPLPACVAP